MIARVRANRLRSMLFLSLSITKQRLRYAAPSRKMLGIAAFAVTFGVGAPKVYDKGAPDKGVLFVLKRTPVTTIPLTRR